MASFLFEMRIHFNLADSRIIKTLAGIASKMKMVKLQDLQSL